MSALRTQQKFSIVQSFARFALAFSVAALGIVLPAPAHALTFDMTGVVFNFNHTTANTTYKNIVGTGTANNDVVLYYNVGTVSGTSIDAVVTTVIVNGGSISSYDPQGANAGVAAGDAPKYFMLNTTAGANTSPSGVSMRFAFYEHGTYTALNTGTPVTLTNVKITSVDLDCNAGEKQYTEFSGFQS